MLELFPEGFEELEGRDGVELAAYTDARGRSGSGTRSAASARARAKRLGGALARLPPAGPGGAALDRAAVAAAPADALAVVVDPGSAFGTGAHATTRLCLELLAAFPPGALLDLGCGSGVLAIAAAKLGFAPVTARRRPVAVEPTRANAVANGVELAVAVGNALTIRFPRSTSSSRTSR